MAIVGAVMAASGLLLVTRQWNAEWRRYQRGFRQLVEKNHGNERARQVPSGYHQIWAKELGRADRCVVCHQATRWKGFESVDHPFRTHPPEILRIHPPDRFGCTSCHGGDGSAVDRETAHGLRAGLGSALLARYQNEPYGIVEERAVFLEANCNLCHRHETETRGAEFVNRAKRVVHERGCRACHVIAGRGGAVGPDLTFVGDQAPDQFDFAHWSGRKTAFAWHVAHFRDPRALVPDSVMPHFRLTARDAQALAVLMLSWQSTPVPASLLPGTPRTDRPAPEDAAEEERMKKGPGAWFVKTGCFVCHSVAGLGVKSPAPIGPDLSTAVDDTVNRFGRDLSDFLTRPTGTMAVVFARQIPFSAEQRAQAVALLRQATAEPRVGKSQTPPKGIQTRPAPDSGRYQESSGMRGAGPWSRQPICPSGGEQRADRLRFRVFAPEERGSRFH